MTDERSEKTVRHLLRANPHRPIVLIPYDEWERWHRRNRYALTIATAAAFFGLAGIALHLLHWPR